MFHSVAVVPLKAHEQVKSRLANVLSLTERQALAQWMAGRTLWALQASDVIARVAVVSPDAEALTWAREQGAESILQAAGDLNDGLTLGREWANAQRADALLIALGDLPLLTPGEVADFVRLATTHERIIALAPDYANRGTNALLAKPPALAPLAFGEGSLVRHLALARAQGIEPTLFHAEGFGFDVDTPADVQRLRATEVA